MGFLSNLNENISQVGFSWPLTTQPFYSIHCSASDISSYSLYLTTAWSTPYTSSSATNSDLLAIGDKLWSADIQKFRLYRGEIELSVQNKTTPDSTIDHASQR